MMSVVSLKTPLAGGIDGSVLIEVEFLLMFSVIYQIPKAIKAGKTVKISNGDFTAEVGAEPNELK